MKKIEIIRQFNLSKEETAKIDFYTNKLKSFNEHTNLVSRSTIQNIWERHILDCLQISKYISNKNSNILDLGTGAGLPGILLSIYGYTNVTMIDSVGKKTKFVEDVIKSLSLNCKVINKRIEEASLSKQDIITCRALAPLNKLLSYALMHSNKKTTLLILKGRNVNNEIKMAKNDFIFNYNTFKSLSSLDGFVLKIQNIKKK